MIFNSLKRVNILDWISVGLFALSLLILVPAISINRALIHSNQRNIDDISKILSAPITHEEFREFLLANPDLVLPESWEE